ncbi:hypothetical protein GQ600_27338 [Phytophthora cactorum]|nr:hypothetical protein GQ600_27338 [Phytophthora cactorum]
MSLSPPSRVNSQFAFSCALRVRVCRLHRHSSKNEGLLDARFNAVFAVAVRAQSSTESSAGTVTAASDATSGSSASTSTSTSTTTSTTTATGSAASDFMGSLSTGSSSGAASDSYHMTPVHVVQARVQSDMPVWNEELQRFAYVGLMDTVNTASVEGALMYVQAEGINYDTRSTEERCTRKNEMAYVVFYEYAIAQTNETLALYAETSNQNDSTTSSGGEGFPTACYYFNGDEGEPEVGPFVGGTIKETDPRAPYPNNVWYSFPNSCPLRMPCQHPSGLCDIGVMPDGVSCTFAYRVLGFILIDDLVGITSMVSNTTGETYANFTEFCEDGGVEFEATESGEWIDGISFWENPQDEDANSERAKKLVEAYYNLTNAHAALPTPEELAAENPACYLNVEKCNSDAGCKRELYGSTCTVCNSTSDGCETPPSDWTFPTLEKAVGENGGTGDASADSSTTTDSTASGNNGDSSSSGAAMNGVSAVLMSTVLALATALFSRLLSSAVL